MCRSSIPVLRRGPMLVGARGRFVASGPEIPADDGCRGGRRGDACLCGRWAGGRAGRQAVGQGCRWTGRPSGRWTGTQAARQLPPSEIHCGCHASTYTLRQYSPSVIRGGGKARSIRGCRSRFGRQDRGRRKRLGDGDMRSNNRLRIVKRPGPNAPHCPLIRSSSSARALCDS